jgi:hypothetical protein
MGLNVVRILISAIFVVLLTSYGMFMIHNETNGKTSKGINDNLIHTNIDTPKEELVRLLEQTITYKKDGIQTSETAFLKYNDNHHYSMYVLPGYRLIEENSQIDRLYYVYDQSLFMNIEFQAENVNWQELKTSTNRQLTSLTKLKPTIKKLKGDFLDESAIHEVKMKDGQILTTYFLHYPNLSLKLTMTTRADADHRDVFFQMAKTIIKISPKK